MRAVVGGMNPITFGTKRAYHAYLRLTRKAFASVGLTAARFDLLLAIRGTLRHEKGTGNGIAQCELPLVLGVCKSVVSRMIKALYGLGLVDSFREGDLRFRFVYLTDKGEAVFRAARDLLMRSVQRVVVTAVCFGRRRDNEERRGRLRQLTNYLAGLRAYLGDKAPLEHPWTQRVPPLGHEWGAPAMTLRQWAPAVA